jgi:hypothetical protein
MKTNTDGSYDFGANYGGFADYVSGATGLSHSPREFHQLPWVDRKTPPRKFMASCVPFDGKFGTYFLVWKPSKGTAHVVRVSQRS